ncbi:MAG: hypothetical protein ACPLZH_00860 [Minisyncoccales bacterium]
MRKRIIFFFLFILILLFFFLSVPQRKISWGINFSQKHSNLLGLDWQKVYLSLIDDLGFKNIRILVHWDLIEQNPNEYYFKDLDWQIQEAEKRRANVILVIGEKTGRWPECHIPDYLSLRGEKIRQEKLLNFLKVLINRYKFSQALFAWQVENEPFFPFGQCPPREEEFLKKEIQLVKELDPGRKIIFSDSGEGSFWIRAALLGDIVGTTLYRKVYFKPLNIFLSYPFPAAFYFLKKKIINIFFKKDVWLLELQAEPWCKNLLYQCDSEEQRITMDFEKFKKIFHFAQRTGFEKIYFWGGEWWYWLKEKNKDSRIFDFVKENIK